MKSTHLIEIQQKLLGAFMENPDAFINCQHLVSKNIFSTGINQDCYKIIKHYHSKNTQPDLHILFNAAKKMGHSPEDLAELPALLNQYLSATQIVEYVCILFNDYARRYLLPKIARLSNDLEDESCDVPEAISALKTHINLIELKLNGVGQERSILDQFDDTMKKIEGVKSGEIEPGYSWGIPSLDKQTMGISQGLNIVAGDKGSGKTTIVVSVIRKNVVEDQIPALFFSLEMTAIDILTNLIANIKRVNSKALRTGQIDDSQVIDIKTIKERLRNGVSIDETGGITWNYFESKVKSHRLKNKIPAAKTMLVMLDYLQLMNNSSEESRMSKEERIEQICNALTRICKNENIALVLLSQFSREGNKRGNDPYLKTPEQKLTALRPRMGDLKGSSAIESNAVQILMLFRPEYYRIYEAAGRNWRGICEINQVKGRFVNPEPLYVKFDGKYNLFEDWIRDEGDINTGGEEAF